MKRALLVLAVLAAAVVWPAASSASVGGGTVVASQRGVMLVASPGGAVSAVAGRASLGSVVRVVSGRAQVVGRSRTARVHGVVIRRQGPVVFLSANRHLVAIRAARTTAGVAGTAPAAPQPGQVVTSQVTIANGELEEQDEQQTGTTGAVQVSATVAAVAAGSVTLTVEGQSLVLPLPGGLTLPASLVGQTVTIQLGFAGPASGGGDDDQGEDGGASLGQPSTSASFGAGTTVTVPGGQAFTGHGQGHGGDGGGDGGGDH